MKKNSIRLRALYDLYITDEDLVIDPINDGRYPEENIIKEGKIFTTDKDTAKILRDNGFAQAPSKYVNKGLRISRKTAQETMKAAEEIKKVLQKITKK